MSLDALAPDQRAVVQLVLQQDRSYADLAGLLGISADAVRERAHRGLERLAPDAGIDAADRAEVTDYLLGQQPVSQREATRSLLSDSQPARSWALAVSGELAGIARSALPEVPGADAPPAERPEPGFEPAETIDEPVEPVDEPVEPAAAEEPAAPVRARPEADTTPVEAITSPVPPDTAEARPRSSLWGGALLIGGLAILVAALIVWLVTKGDPSDSASTPTTSTSTSPQASATATATPQFQPRLQLAMTPASGTSAKGRLVVFASAKQEVAFTIQGTDMPASKPGEAYGVWLTGGDAPHFLGFASAVGADGKFGTSGPRPEDAAKFTSWLSSAKQVVVSRETQQGASSPHRLVLTGALDKIQGVATPTATP